MHQKIAFFFNKLTLTTFCTFEASFSMRGAISGYRAVRIQPSARRVP
jgi:hypothetical protein